MNKELLEALESVKNEYDAFYFENKFGVGGTHDKEFELLKSIKGKKVVNAIAWIKDCYDCYYKNELDDNSAFAYLEKLIKGELKEDE